MAEIIFETDGKDRFDKLWYNLNLDNKKLEGLFKDDLRILRDVLDVNSNIEVMNSSSISEARLIKSKIYPTIESQLNLYEESKLSH